MKIQFPRIRELSFPDCPITGFSFDSSQRSFRVVIDGFFLNKEELFQGMLVVMNWEAMDIKQYHLEYGKWKNLEPSAIEPISEILEQKFSKELVTLRGFGKLTRHWTEFTFYKSVVYFEFNPKDD